MVFSEKQDQSHGGFRLINRVTSCLGYEVASAFYTQLIETLSGRGDLNAAKSARNWVNLETYRYV